MRKKSSLLMRPLVVNFQLHPRPLAN